MGKEIERKFLVRDNSYKKVCSGKLYKQGYLNSNPERTVRVRIVDNKGFLTIKDKGTGFTRSEFEYEIPYTDAEEILKNICEKPFIEKTRYIYNYMGYTWEIDEFHGENEGLVVAEIELDNENDTFSLPEWIGEEVTTNYKYFNSYLKNNPFKNWDK
ncbi:CYTH domain-containing protein [Acetivibrio cellulolyticus]|uniref:CYTH domain-containing protein n=1 Tax=Acetivibrio cellulolyticus TaxID=35830 RepID=UPI0001E2D8AE|nr:CYTH domain-containing protein [Acetivibrio cellulolyticus]